MPRNTNIRQEVLQYYYPLHKIFEVQKCQLKLSFPLSTLIKVYPFGITSDSGEFKLTCPTICGLQAINISGKQCRTVSQKGSLGVSVSLHFSHTSVVCNVTL
jgi:hypothetical protein